MKKSKVELYWEKLFDKYNIINEIDRNGTFEITADQIKEFKEPRLMTKFDWSDSKPDVFKREQLSVLPNTRGTYILGRFKAYERLTNKEISPEKVSLPGWVRTFDNFKVTSEAVALNVAQMTGMIDKVMGTLPGESGAVSTITGRAKSGIIEYNIDLYGTDDQYDFKVNNSQIEIDAGFENMNNLAVIEAKSRIPKDFMIRQLYYPYRTYRMLNTDKKILPIYFTHADDIYTFHVFEFTDPTNYSSIRPIKQFSFIVNESLDLSIDDVLYISKNSKNEEDSYMFPQADSMTRLLNSIKYLKSKGLDKYELANENNFNLRQGDYYGNALCYLGLATKGHDKKYKLTEIGKTVSQMSNSNKRNEIIIKQILNNKSFNLIFKKTINDKKFNIKSASDIILNHGKSVGSLVTARRRASTAKNWIEWILKAATKQ